MSHLFANNATSRLKIITPAGSTTLTLLDGEGAKFPSPVAPDIFLVTIDDRRTGQIEICRCTARTGDILTVVRGQEGTVAQDFVEWATVSNRATAGTFQYLLDVVLNAAGWGKIEADERFLNTIGDTATGPIKGVAPTAPEDLTRRDYVDTQDATKASKVHTHPISDVTNLQQSLDSKIGPAPSDGADYVQYNGNWAVFNWSTLDGKPLSFTPQSHMHPMAEVLNLESTLAGMNAEILIKVGPEAPTNNVIYGRKNAAWVDVSTALNWDQIPGMPDTFPPDVHQHAIADVIGLQPALDGKEPVIATGNPAYFWAGDKTWKAFQQTVAAASVGDGPPSSPVPGQLWWETDTGYLFLRYQDVNSQQWVQVNNPGIPDAPYDGQQYARKDGDWVGVTGGGPGGGISEAPADGQVYNRKGSTASWVVATSLDWGNITGKPATFPPTLPIPESGVTNLVADLAAKEPTITAGLTTQYYRGDKSWQLHDKASVGLGSVDNTSDANKPLSSATVTALSGKEPSLPGGGTTSTFLRGDKTWAVPGGGGLSDGDKGDIVVSGAGTVLMLDATVVTPAAKSVLDDTSTAAMLATLGAAPTSHAHTASQVTDFAEAVDDRVGALLVAGTNVTLTYNDATNTLTVAASGGSGGGGMPIGYHTTPGQAVPSIEITDSTTGQPALRAYNFLGQYIDICTPSAAIDTTGDVYFGGVAQLYDLQVDKITSRGSWPTSGEPPNLVLDGTTLELSVSTVVTPKITVNNVAPSSPAVNDLWVDTN